MSSTILKDYHWTDFFRHCAICQATFPPIQWLCSYCLKQLKDYYIPPQYMDRLESSFRHFRLIDWTKENDQFIRKLLFSLKGPKGNLFFNFLAKEFCFRIQQHLKQKPFILTPCPPHEPFHPLTHLLRIRKMNQEKRDHSYYWGKALSHWTGYHLESFLQRTQHQTSQKSKSILERKKISFTLNPLKTLPKNKNFIFTDDVLTSGSTAKAVHLALRKPKPFWIWSIFWRKYDTQ